MSDGDHYDFCCSCGTEFLVRTMHQVTSQQSCLFMCVRCLTDYDGTREEGSDWDDWDHDWSQHEGGDVP